MNIRLTGLVAVALASFAVAGHAAGVKGQGTWETTLQARDLDGNVANGAEAFYDTALNITWLRSAATKVQYWMPPSPPTTARLYAEWKDANAWAKQDHFGISGWRLPATKDTGSVGCNYSAIGGTDCGNNPDSSVATGSEMAHLFYVTLGNKSIVSPVTGAPQTGGGLTNSGDFQYMENNEYWSGSQYTHSTPPSTFPPGYFPAYWYFDAARGTQHWYSQGYNLQAMAVRDGDVTAAVPEPQTYALMLAGLGLIAGIARKRSKQQ